MRIVLRWSKGRKVVRRFRFIFDVRKDLRHLNKEAAFDSMKNILAVLGLGLLLGDFATMHALYALPGAVLLVAVWYADYLRHDFPEAEADVDRSGALIQSENVLKKEPSGINAIETQVKLAS